MNLTSIRKLVENDLLKVDQKVSAALSSDIPLIPKLCAHIVHSGGKRLRPLIVLLGARSLGYQGEYHIDLAASLELVHTATLLHDDVIDASELRRGKKTANAIWGNSASVLVGDFLYTRAFQLIVSPHNWLVLEKLTEATRCMAEGEILQLTQCYNSQLEEQDCLQIIRNKTGALFSTAAVQGALLTYASDQIVQQMSEYGMNLGIAFQLVDDALDYCGSKKEFGKNQGDDLAEGKLTIPLLYALKHGDSHQTAVIREAVQQGSVEQLEFILDAIESTKAITYTYTLAKQYATSAAECLKQIPDSAYRDALSEVTHFVLERAS